LLAVAIGASSSAQEQEPTSIPTPFEEFQPPVLERSAGQNCPRLDTRLSQLAASPDPVAFAASARLTLGPSGVLAIVEIAGVDGLDPNAYGLTIEGQYANLLQARVPLDQLCDLATDPAVSRVRPPATPDPGSESSVEQRLEGV
jgi:hypothetical protein